MTCDKCPNLKPIEGGYFECTYFVHKDGTQMLSKHSLKDKVDMLSKPIMCEVDENGDEPKDD